MSTVLLFREFVFYTVYSALEFLLVATVGFSMYDEDMVLVRLTFSAQFLVISCAMLILLLGTLVWGPYGESNVQDPATSIDPSDGVSDEKPDTKLQADALAPAVLLATASVTGGVFLVVLAGTIGCLDTEPGTLGKSICSGNVSTALMCMVLVMQAQIFFSTVITYKAYSTAVPLPPTLYYTAGVCATASSLFVLLSVDVFETAGAWLSRNTALFYLWVVSALATTTTMLDVAYALTTVSKAVLITSIKAMKPVLLLSLCVVFTVVIHHTKYTVLRILGITALPWAYFAICIVFQAYPPAAKAVQNLKTN